MSYPDFGLDSEGFLDQINFESGAGGFTLGGEKIKRLISGGDTAIDQVAQLLCGQLCRTAIAGHLGADIIIEV
tara:strand:- start:6 stop:224 length:219 start_codon:yes stop_codon:yes gene_type:complete